MKLSFARIATRDVAKLVAFYRDVTGISPAGSDEYVEFATPTSGLAIVSQRALERHGMDVTAPAANRSVILDFEVGDVDRERARLAGNRSMLFRDPDGNLVNFFAPIDRAARGQRREKRACRKSPAIIRRSSPFTGSWRSSSSRHSRSAPW